MDQERRFHGSWIQTTSPKEPLTQPKAHWKQIDQLPVDKFWILSQEDEDNVMICYQHENVNYLKRFSLLTGKISPSAPFPSILQNYDVILALGACTEDNKDKYLTFLFGVKMILQESSEGLSGRLLLSFPEKIKELKVKDFDLWDVSTEPSGRYVIIILIRSDIDMKTFILVDFQNGKITTVDKVMNVVDEDLNDLQGLLGFQCKYYPGFFYFNPKNLTDTIIHHQKIKMWGRVQHDMNMVLLTKTSSSYTFSGIESEAQKKKTGNLRDAFAEAAEATYGPEDGRKMRNHEEKFPYPSSIDQFNIHARQMVFDGNDYHIILGNRIWSSDILNSWKFMPLDSSTEGLKTSYIIDSCNVVVLVYQNHIRIFSCEPKLWNTEWLKPHLETALLWKGENDLILRDTSGGKLECNLAVLTHCSKTFRNMMEDVRLDKLEKENGKMIMDLSNFTVKQVATLIERKKLKEQEEYELLLAKEQLEFD